MAWETIPHDLRIFFHDVVTTKEPTVKRNERITMQYANETNNHGNSCLHVAVLPQKCSFWEISQPKKEP